MLHSAWWEDIGLPERTLPSRMSALAGHSGAGSCIQGFGTFGVADSLVSLHMGLALS